jgi:hypothetical protein
MGSAKDKEQKEHEKFLLDRFFELQGISPTGLKQPDPPALDGLIDLEGRKVGIELTELFIRSNKSEAHPQPTKDLLLQEIESITDRIVSKARKIYFDADNPHVLSTIWFSDRITLDRMKGDRIAELIAHQIQSMSLQNSQKAAWRSSDDENVDHPLSESVAIIHTYRVPERRFARWTVARPGFVVTLTPKRLQEVIDKKAKKINSYKKYAEETWLLIVADNTRPSQRFSVAPDFPLDSVSSPFQKTFYYDYVLKGVIDLSNNVKTSAAIL